MARSRSVWAAASAGAALAALWAVSAGGCFQASGLGDITFAQPEAGTACTSASQCDDQNACTTDTCTSTGECTHLPIADGPLPAAEQTQGDCKQITCKGGQPGTVADPANVPPATDMCTAASCDGDTPVQKAQPDGTACDLSGAPGECKGGKCTVACKEAADCPSKGACQTASCNGAMGICEYSDVPDGTPTPGVTQAPGTCKAHICLMGVDTDAVDDSNVPAVPQAMAGCADGKCTDGVPSIPLHAPDSQCSTWMGTMAGFCDGAGACSQCNEASECAGTSPTNDCQTPTCNAGNLCVPKYTAAGTPTVTTPPQTPGNCMQVVCDGNGGTTANVDTSNTPADTDQGCTLGTCTGGTPGSKSAPNGQSCAAGSCGGSTEACLNGMCAGCTQACQCQGGGTEPNGTCVSNACSCTPSTCGGLGLTCGDGIANGCAGNPLDCNTGTVAGQETDVDCGGPTAACATRCAQGKKCKVTSDCGTGLTCADGVCCNQACAGACEACTALLKGQGADGVCGAVISGDADPHQICTSQAASTCGDEGGTCNGSGACTTWPTGTQCAAPVCAGDVLTKAETCVGSVCTALVPATQSCAPYACTGGACLTSCTVDTQCAAGDYCKGTTCTPTKSQGAVCTANDQCATGSCVDSFCCDSPCAIRCQACSAKLTGGTNGTCAGVIAGTPDPSGICAATAPTSCGEDGNCTAGGLCEKYGSTTVCVEASCSGGMQTTEGTCGGGACKGSKTTACTPYVCGAKACLTTCTTDADCIAGDVCNLDTCLP